MTARVRRALTAAAIFGLCDGEMSILGVVLDLRTHPELVPWAATVGAVSAGASMAVGQYVAEDNDNGVAACTVLGMATAVGSVLPALPFLALRGSLAVVGTALVCLVLAGVVARLRSRGSMLRALVVLALLAAVFGVTLACALLAPTGGAA